ncbi:helix-turn-helix domain-containing protein [Pseudorhodoferax sp. LjRoot39]|uniref:IclR family transcriptional regulator n=1 Tax=Pseudorhodoferax sp. LjRoot39 TaxID=3342328 RepID=UPI003ECD5405
MTGATRGKADKDAGNRSLLRGLAVLDCIGRHAGRGIRVSDIMSACQLERATVYRLLATLQDCGYITTAERFHYVPTNRVAPHDGSQTDALARRLAPVLERVSEQTGDAAFAVVREGTQSHCVARHIGTFPVQVLGVQVGRRQPLGVGAAGLALLATLPPAEAESIAESNAAALDAYGGMTKARLLKLLAATRERGWSVVANHVAQNTLGVGIAVSSVKGQFDAAISVAAPLERMSPARQLQIARLMKEAFAVQERQRRSA